VNRVYVGANLEIRPLRVELKLHPYISVINYAMTSTSLKKSWMSNRSCQKRIRLYGKRRHEKPLFYSKFFR